MTSILEEMDNNISAAYSVLHRHDDEYQMYGTVYMLRLVGIGSCDKVRIVCMHAHQFLYLCKHSTVDFKIDFTYASHKSIDVMTILTVFLQQNEMAVSNTYPMWFDIPNSTTNGHFWVNLLHISNATLCE